MNLMNDQKNLTNERTNEPNERTNEPNDVIVMLETSIQSADLFTPVLRDPKSYHEME